MEIDKGKKKKPRRHMLKNLDVGEISFVGIGANEGARQTLFKMETGPESVFKQLFNELLAEFDASEAAADLLYNMLRYNEILAISMIEIMENAEIDDRKAALRDTVAEFAEAISTMVNDSELAKELAGFQVSKSEDPPPAGDFAFVPNANDSSTWKLRIYKNGAVSPILLDAALSALGEGLDGDRLHIEKEARDDVLAKIKSAWLVVNGDKGAENMPLILKNAHQKGVKKPMSDEIKKQLEAMQLRLDRAEAIAKMDDATKVYFNTLDEDGQAAFIKMDDTERVDSVSKANKPADDGDETFEANGKVIRKSVVGDDVFAVLKSQQDEIDDNKAKLEKSQEAAAVAEFTKTAEGLFPNLPGEPVAKGKALRAIRKLDKANVETIEAMLKAGNEGLEKAKAFEEIGAGGQPDETSPIAKLNKMAEEKAKSDNVTFHVAYDAVMKTDEGRKLYEESLKPAK
jgi:hypothetical protein